jgi:hypothetical protein
MIILLKILRFNLQKKEFSAEKSSLDLRGASY